VTPRLYRTIRSLAVRVALPLRRLSIAAVGGATTIALIAQYVVGPISGDGR